MARPLRVEFPGAHYHVMNWGFERRPIFLRDADHRRFVDLLQEVSDRWRVEIFAYCCMTTHYHLLLHTPLGNLSRVMRHLGGLYAQRFNRADGRDGPLFRGRYKALLVDADAYLLQVVRYIHLNPVEVGVVSDPGAYPWSSHSLYRRSQPPEWLARGKVLAMFSDLQAFERFVAEGNEQSLTAFYQRERWSPFLGDDAFVARALEKARLSSAHSRAERTPQFPTIDAVVRFVCQKTGASPDAVVASQRGQRNFPRTLAIYISGRIAGFPYPEICRYFRLGTHGAVTRVCQRTERLLSSDHALRRLIQQRGVKT